MGRESFISWETTEGEKEKSGREGGISTTHKLQTFCELQDQLLLFKVRSDLCFLVFLSLQQHGFELN